MKCGGMGIKDGRGYGPYGAGYYVYGTHQVAPFGPRCERLPPTPEWDARVQAALGEAPDIEQYKRRRKTFNLVMAGVLGATALLLGWAFYPYKHD